MLLKFKALLMLFMLATINNVRAGDIHGVEITNINEYHGLIFVTVSSPIPNSPACVINNDYKSRLVFDAKTPEGKITYTTLLAGYALGNKFSFIGRGTCDLWSDGVETLEYSSTYR